MQEVVQHGEEDEHAGDDVDGEGEDADWGSRAGGGGEEDYGRDEVGGEGEEGVEGEDEGCREDGFRVLRRGGSLGESNVGWTADCLGEGGCGEEDVGLGHGLVVIWRGLTRMVEW